MLKINVFGSLQISHCDTPIQNNLGLKEQCLLTYLLTEQKPLYDRETLSQLLWEETGRENSLGSLRLAIWNIRKFFKLYGISDVIDSQGNRYIRFRFEDIQSDILVWREVLSSGDRTISALETVSALYRDDFLKNLYLKNNISFNDWVLTHRDLLQREFAHTQIELTDLYVKAGRFENAIREINRIIAIDPYNEKFYHLKMKIQYQTGNKAAAIYTYNKLKRILMNELNVSPDTFISELYHKIVSGETIASHPGQDQSGVKTSTSRSLQLFLCDNDVRKSCSSIFSSLNRSDSYVIDLCKAPGKRVDYEGLFELMDAVKVVFSSMAADHYEKYLSVCSDLQEKHFPDYILFSNILSLLDQLMEMKIVFRIWDADALDVKSMDFIRFVFLNSVNNSFDCYILSKDCRNHAGVNSLLTMLNHSPDVEIQML